MRAQQRKHGPVTLGEVRPGPAEEEQPNGPAGPGARPRGIGQGQQKLMLDPVRPVEVAVHARAVPLPGRVEIRDLDDTAQVAGALGITAGLAVPPVLPVRRVPFDCLEVVAAWSRDALQGPVRLPHAVEEVDGRFRRSGSGPSGRPAAIPAALRRRAGRGGRR